MGKAIFRIRFRIQNERIYIDICECDYFFHKAFTAAAVGWMFFFSSSNVFHLCMLLTNWEYTILEKWANWENSSENCVLCTNLTHSHSNAWKWQWKELNRWTTIIFCSIKLLSKLQAEEEKQGHRYLGRILSRVLYFLVFTIFHFVCTFICFIFVLVPFLSLSRNLISICSIYTAYKCYDKGQSVHPFLLCVAHSIGHHFFCMRHFYGNLIWCEHHFCYWYHFNSSTFVWEQIQALDSNLYKFEIFYVFVSYECDV